jgi:hypothetical protein
MPVVPTDDTHGTSKFPFFSHKHPAPSAVVSPCRLLPLICALSNHVCHLSQLGTFYDLCSLLWEQTGTGRTTTATEESVVSRLYHGEALLSTVE